MHPGMYVVLLPASSAICPLSCTALLTPHLWLPPSGRFAHIERVNQQRGELVQRRDELHQRLGGAERALAGAQQEQQKMQKVGGWTGGWVGGRGLAAWCGMALVAKACWWWHWRTPSQAVVRGSWTTPNMPLLPGCRRCWPARSGAWVGLPPPVCGLLRSSWRLHGGTLRQRRVQNQRRLCRLGMATPSTP
jgi:hypothetical protein